MQEVAATLQTWAETLKGGRGRGPIVVHRTGEKLTLRADSMALRQKRARLEFDDERLQLDVRGRTFALSLGHFDAAMRLEGNVVAITLELRPSEPATSLSEAVREAAEQIHVDLRTGFERILEASEVTVLQRALLTRVVKAIADVTEGVEERVAAEALSASSDEMVLLRLLEQPGVIATLKASDPLGPARVRGIAARQQMIDLAGGTLSSEEAARALHLTRQAVEKRRRAGRLLALSLGRRGHRYPAFQFGEGGLPGLERVLGALKDHDPWTQLAFFVTRQSDLDDQTAVVRLRAGDVETVLRAAGAVGEHGAA
jgi:hypothetical protein